MVKKREQNTTQAPPAQDLRAKRAESGQRPGFGKALLTNKRFQADTLARAQLARRDFQELAAQGIAFSPFLEIGAGRAQRSLVLVKDHEVQGVATDISLPPLQDAPYVQLSLSAPHLPFRICCDMHHLPFQDNTFRFIFAYRTLHHVPNPVATVAELYRVLGRGGHFFCNEEPMLGPVVHWLRGDRELASPMTPLQRLAARFRLHKLFWDDGAWERSVGIVEARFPLSLWQEALAPFAQVEATVSRRLQLKTDMRAPTWQQRLAQIVGGNVRALCRKEDGHPVTTDRFLERLRCLDCESSGVERRDEYTFHCRACGRRYGVREGVLLMFPRKLQQQLYPPAW